MSEQSVAEVPLRKSILSPSTIGTMSCNDESSLGETAVREKCKDRMDSFKKQVKKTMPLSD